MNKKRHAHEFKDLLTVQFLEQIERMPEEGLPGLWDIRTRPVWEGLDPALRQKLVTAGRQAKDASFPLLRLSDYREFSLNGNRSRFEDRYFSRRRLLTRLTIAECVQADGEFLEKLLDGLWLLLEETTWCLPAHNTLIRDTPAASVPDPRHPVIDLFAAETAAVTGLCAYLTRPVLEPVSPVLADYVNQRIRERILEPYLSYPFWWKGDGEQQLLNWTPWITMNILIALFTRPSGFWQAGERTAVLRQAASSLDYYLDSFGDDGCCDEGAQYYGHAGLSLFGCMDLLDRIAEAAAANGSGRHPYLESLWHLPLIRNIASYIVKVYAGNGYYLNYADCSPLPGRRTARDFLFGLRTGETALAAFAARDYRSQSWDERILPEEENLYVHLLQLFSHEEMMQYPEAAPVVPDAWFESTGLMVARDRIFVLAAKAGDNGENHNHNDVGSVILYKEGHPFLIDLGVETYTALTFSDRRYEIWTMQSSWHNLPAFFDGDSEVMQKAGRRYRASQVRHESAQDHASLEMELAGAYADPRIRSYSRRVTLWRGRGVELTDEYQGELAGALTLMTYEEPFVEVTDPVTQADPSEYTKEAEHYTGNEDAPALPSHLQIAHTIRIGRIGSIHIEDAERIETEICPIRDPRLSVAWKHDCFRIRIHFRQGRIRLFFS